MNVYAEVTNQHTKIQAHAADLIREGILTHDSV